MARNLLIHEGNFQQESRESVLIQMGGYATLQVPHIPHYVKLSSICLYILIISWKEMTR
jgi:hypothetical protein